jgi:hypothetical protein
VINFSTRLARYEESDIHQYELNLLLRKDRNRINFQEFVLVSLAEVHNSVTIQRIDNGQTEVRDSDLIIVESCLNFRKALGESNNY